MSNKELDIYEFIQLCHIDEIKEIFTLTMEQVKASKAGEYIENYRTKKSNYRRELFDDVLKKEKKKNKGKKKNDKEMFLGEEPPLYWFVLTRFRDWVWHITEIEPEPPDYAHALGILPNDLIMRMTNLDFAVNPEKVEGLDAVFSSEFDNFYDIRFVRYSSNTVFGTVRQDPARKEEVFAKLDISPEKRDEMAFKIFDYAMAEFPALKRKLVDILLDSGLLLMDAQEKVKAAEAAEAMAKELLEKEIEFPEDQ